MIVADTNLIAHFHVTGEWTGRAEAVRHQDPVWVAPTLWRSEFRNVVVGLVRAGRLDADDARAIVAEAEWGMVDREYAVVSHDVVDLAIASGCTAYDCEFVALATGLGVRLVTTDREVLGAFPSVAVSPDAFLR